MKVYILHYRIHGALPPGEIRNVRAHLAVLCDDPKEALKHKDLRRDVRGHVISRMKIVLLSEAEPYLIRAAEGLIVRSIEGHLKLSPKRKRAHWRFSSRIGAGLLGPGAEVTFRRGG